MITVRDDPNKSVIDGPICQTQYMFIATCNSPACSHPALSTVHQRPAPNTGTAPLEPNTNSTCVLGDSADRMLPPPLTPAPDINRVTSHSATQAPTTSCANPKFWLNCRSAGPNPNSPGFERPHIRHLSSRTPTSEPHDGHTTEPDVRRLSIPTLSLPSAACSTRGCAFSGGCSTGSPRRARRR